MNKNDIDKRINEIDAKLARLENEETSYEEMPKRKLIDQTNEAIEILRECVKEVLEIDDLKACRELNPKLYDNRMLTIVSWFNYLKRKNQDTKEFEEAKNLILSIGNKYQNLAQWCKDLVDKPLPKPSVSKWDADLNADIINELINKNGK